MVEESISKIEDRTIEIIHSEKRREKRLDNLLWQYHAELTHMSQSPEEKREKMQQKKIIVLSLVSLPWVLPSYKYPRSKTPSYSIDRNFCVYYIAIWWRGKRKKINLQIQEIQWIPGRINTKKTIPGHSIVKLLKVKDLFNQPLTPSREPDPQAHAKGWALIWRGRQQSTAGMHW